MGVWWVDEMQGHPQPVIRKSVRQPTKTVEAARSAAAVLSPFKQGAGIPERSPRGPIIKGEWAQGWNACRLRGVTPSGSERG